MKVVDNLWTTRRSPVQLIHIFAMYLTSSVRWIRLKRAAEADCSLRRIRLLPQLCLCIGLISIQMQPGHAVTPSQVNQYKLYAHSRIIDAKQYRCLESLYERESNWNPLARSGSHYGIPQMRNIKVKTLDPYTQIDWGIRYIKGRYGTPCKAWTFFQEHRYH